MQFIGKVLPKELLYSPGPLSEYFLCRKVKKVGITMDSASGAQELE